MPFNSPIVAALDKAEQEFRIAWSVRSIDKMTVRQALLTLRVIWGIAKHHDNAKG